MHNKSSKIPQRAYELNPVLRDGHLEKQVAKGAVLDGALDDFLNFWICQYVFEYTSVGPDMKTPVRLTGVISMNKAVFNREVEPKDRKHNITFVPKAFIFFKAINKKNSSSVAKEL